VGKWTPTVRFGLETASVNIEGQPEEVVRAVLGEECTVTAAAMLAAEQGHDDAGDKKQDRAMQFLRGHLETGPKAVSAIKEAAEAAGHAWRTIERAKKDMGAEAFQPKGTNGWSWRLPTVLEI